MIFNLIGGTDESKDKKLQEKLLKKAQEKIIKDQKLEEKLRAKQKAKETKYQVKKKRGNEFYRNENVVIEKEKL